MRARKAMTPAERHYRATWRRRERRNARRVIYVKAMQTMQRVGLVVGTCMVVAMLVGGIWLLNGLDTTKSPEPGPPPYVAAPSAPVPSVPATGRSYGELMVEGRNWAAGREYGEAKADFQQAVRLAPDAASRYQAESWLRYIAMQRDFDRAQGPTAQPPNVVPDGWQSARVPSDKEIIDAWGSTMAYYDGLGVDPTQAEQAATDQVYRKYGVTAGQLDDAIYRQWQAEAPGVPTGR